MNNTTKKFSRCDSCRDAHYASAIELPPRMRLVQRVLTWVYALALVVLVWVVALGAQP